MHTLGPVIAYDATVDAPAVLYSDPIYVDQISLVNAATRVLGDVSVTVTAESNNASEGQINAGEDADLWVSDDGYDAPAYAPAAKTVDTDPMLFFEVETDVSASLTAIRKTIAALPACTAAGSGVGKTLTMDAVGILTVDGRALVLNDKILVTDQDDARDNGFYKLTTAGTVSVAAVLTRDTAFDAAEVVEGTLIEVSGGTAAGLYVLSGRPFSAEWTTGARRMRFKYTITAATYGGIRTQLFGKGA